jgi:nitrate/nitrite transporter NarK
MNHPSKRKRIIRLWIGIILFSISAFIWMMLIIAIVAEPEEVGHVISSGLVLTIIPVVAGIYCVRHPIGRYKRRV